ncbi:sugar transferase [Devosia soli]|uniref:sugar transferase n=1 Tax=Devosia soli TaxID=361041 RepID=UPI000A05BAD7|nr:sugar transferase [Devosia soli]
MKIVITGASGVVGRALVYALTSKGVSLLLVGRDTNRLKQQFPEQDVCGYDDFGRRAVGADLVLHLAALNNSVRASESDFYAINVKLALATAETARAAGIPLFVYVSSTHALDDRRNDPYSESKRLGSSRLAQVSGITVTTLYLAAVHGDTWAGKLSVLNSLPAPLANGLFSMLSALRPTTSITAIVQFVLKAAISPQPKFVILTDQQYGNRVYGFISRTTDLLGATLIGLLLWWLFLILWAAIRLQSRGPGIFAQERVGRGGRIFTCFKFRTMKAGTPQTATNLVSGSAVTSLGRVLRRTKLDELPQIWNIFRNEMSFIGPRPCLPTQRTLVEARERLGVLDIKPGISGLAQVAGVDMSDPHLLAELDARYLALRSLALDANIVLATIRGNGQGDNTAT